MWPAVAFASQAWLFLLMIGLFAQIAGLMTFAIVLYAVVVLFQLVTLPVEFDASRRAMAQLSRPRPRLDWRVGRPPRRCSRWLRRRRPLAALQQLAYWLLVLNNRN